MSIRLFRPSQKTAEANGEMHRDLYRWFVELVQTFNDLLAGSLTLAGTGDADGNPGLEGTAATGSDGSGVQGYGDGSGAGGYFTGGATGSGVVGQGGDTSGYGGLFTANAGNGVGCYGSGHGTGAGVYGRNASSGPGVIAEGDTSSPVKAAFRIVPQDAEPTGPNLVGDIYVTSAGVLRICTVAGSPGTWVNVGSQ